MKAIDILKGQNQEPEWMDCLPRIEENSQIKDAITTADNLFFEAVSKYLSKYPHLTLVDKNKEIVKKLHTHPVRSELFNLLAQIESRRILNEPLILTGQAAENFKKSQAYLDMIQHFKHGYQNNIGVWLELSLDAYNELRAECLKPINCGYAEIEKNRMSLNSFLGREIHINKLATEKFKWCKPMEHLPPSMLDPLLQSYEAYFEKYGSYPDVLFISDYFDFVMKRSNIQLKRNLDLGARTFMGMTVIGIGAFDENCEFKLYESCDLERIKDLEARYMRPGDVVRFHKFNGLKARSYSNGSEAPTKEAVSVPMCEIEVPLLRAYNRLGLDPLEIKKVQKSYRDYKSIGYADRY